LISKEVVARLMSVGEREQLESQWDSLSPAQRFELFRAWILSETAGFQPSELVLFHWTGGDLVVFSFASDFSSWQVAVGDSLFTNDSPSQALGIGEGIIESAHLFAEQQEDADELEEEELEDESTEAQEYAEEQAREAALEAANEALEALAQEAQAQLDAAMGDDDLEGTSFWQSVLDSIQAILDLLRDKLNEFLDASA